jgi:hypothetical protein
LAYFLTSLELALRRLMTCTLPSRGVKTMACKRSPIYPSN